MGMPAFDTLETAKELQAGGFTRVQAETLVRVLVNVGDSWRRFRDSLRQAVDREAELSKLREKVADLNAANAVLEADNAKLKSDIAVMKTDGVATLHRKTA